MFIVAGHIIQNVARTFEKTRIRENGIFLLFRIFFGHKIQILHDIELKITENM